MVFMLLSVSNEWRFRLQANNLGWVLSQLIAGLAISSLMRAARPELPPLNSSSTFQDKHQGRIDRGLSYSPSSWDWVISNSYFPSLGLGSPASEQRPDNNGLSYLRCFPVYKANLSHISSCDMSLTKIPQGVIVQERSSRSLKLKGHKTWLFDSKLKHV